VSEDGAATQVSEDGAVAEGDCGVWSLR